MDMQELKLDLLGGEIAHLRSLNPDVKQDEIIIIDMKGMLLEYGDEIIKLNTYYLNKNESRGVISFSHNNIKYSSIVKIYNPEEWPKDYRLCVKWSKNNELIPLPMPISVIYQYPNLANQSDVCILT